MYLHRLYLRLYAQLCRLESVFLRHGVFRTIYTVQYQLPEIWEPNFSRNMKMMFALFVHHKNMVQTAIVHTYVYIFSQLE